MIGLQIGTIPLGPIGLVGGGLALTCIGGCYARCSGRRGKAYCLGNETTIEVSDDGYVSQKPISEIKSGDKVFTIANHSKVLTTVVWSEKSVGVFDFDIIFIGKSIVVVTPTHGLLKMGSEGDVLVMATSKDVIAGDVMVTAEGLERVLSVEHTHREEKYTLVTEEGSVLASGVLVSTMCEDVYDVGTPFLSAVADWRRLHKNIV
jgi:hypothetical protein